MPCPPEDLGFLDALRRSRVPFNYRETFLGLPLPWSKQQGHIQNLELKGGQRVHSGHNGAVSHNAHPLETT